MSPGFSVNRNELKSRVQPVRFPKTSQVWGEATQFLGNLNQKPVRWAVKNFRFLIFF